MKYETIYEIWNKKYFFRYLLRILGKMEKYEHLIVSITNIYF